MASEVGPDQGQTNFLQSTKKKHLQGCFRSKSRQSCHSGCRSDQIFGLISIQLLVKHRLSNNLNKMGQCFPIIFLGLLFPTGKWVVNGGGSFGNYLRIGLFGGKFGTFTGPKFIWPENPITRRVRLKFPSDHFFSKDGNWKSYLFGQFHVR